MRPSKGRQSSVQSRIAVASHPSDLSRSNLPQDFEAFPAMAGGLGSDAHHAYLAPFPAASFPPVL